MNKYKKAGDSSEPIKAIDASAIRARERQKMKAKKTLELKKYVTKKS